MKLLRLAPESTKFGFMRFRRISYPFSAVLSIISVALFLIIGMNFGIDFAGGTLMELRAKSGTADMAELRAAGEKLGLGEIEVQALIPALMTRARVSISRHAYPRPVTAIFVPPCTCPP